MANRSNRPVGNVSVKDVGCDGDCPTAIKLAAALEAVLNPPPVYRKSVSDATQTLKEYRETLFEFDMGES
jgi:hypothetical protein